MVEVIAFVSIKGGVGKTTMALETASVLANVFEKRVLLVDANFSAPNVGLYLDLTSDLTLHDALGGTPVHNTIYESYGVDVIPASLYYHEEIDVLQLKKILEKFKPRYDYIIIDSSPNYEELKPVINAADKIFIVTSADHVTLETSLKAAVLAKNQNTPVEGLIVNRIRSPKHEFNLSEIEKISEIPVLARIKDSKAAIVALHNKKPVTINSPRDILSKEVIRFVSALCGESEVQSKFLSMVKSSVSKEKVNRDLYRQKYYESQIGERPKELPDV